MSDADDTLPATAKAMRSLFGGMFRYACHYRNSLLVLAVGLCFESLFDVAVRYSLRFVIEAVVQRDMASLVPIVSMLGGGALLFNFVVIGCDYVWAKTGGRIINDIRFDLFNHLQALPLGYHRRQSTGDLMARFNADVAQIDTGMVLGFPMAAMGVVEIVATLGLMFLVHPLLCAVAGGGILVCLIVPHFLQRTAVAASYAFRRLEGRVVGNLEESLTGQNVIKAYGLERMAAGSFSARLDELLTRRVKADFLSYLVSRLPSLIFLLLLLVVLGAGGWLAIQGEITVGELVAYQALLMGLNNAIYNLTWTFPSFIEAAAGWWRIREVLDEPVSIADAPGATTLQRFSSAIEFHDVYFSYLGAESDALRGINVKFSAGEYVAIVGRSGAGKSSLINLLIRFYEVSQGRILIDAHDVRDVTLQSLRRQLGLVSQEVMLFDTSARENIRLGSPTASDEEIVAAAKAAEIHNRIQALPNGYDEPVGLGGSNLSGGERQRIALARALVRQPAILVLDEFSAALDPATEAEILETIERLKGTCTILSATHRILMTSAADRVIVLKDGRIVETGSSDALLATPGEYARLWNQAANEKQP